MSIHAVPPLTDAPAQVLLAHLAERLGAAHVRTDPDEIALHLREERGLYTGTALAVVRPGSTEEVAFVVRECAAAGVAIVPQGGNTGLVGGGVPYGGIVLSLARLNRIRELDAVNATMVAEAGCVLADVQRAAAEAGLLFPLSLPSEGSCRIGGNLATNAGGTAVLRYGNARELALGLEVVLADGRIWNGLTALRKDNTGYDLKNLFMGSEGTLGIITAAVLKLFPGIRSRATAFVGLASPHDALRLFERLRAAAGAELTAFEYMPRFALEIVLRHHAAAVRPLAGEHHSYGLIELASPQQDADLAGIFEEVVGAAIEDGLVEDATIASSDAQRLALWDLRERLSEVQRYEGGSIKHDVAVPVSRVAEFIDQATAACESEMPGVRVCAFGHFGDGNIHFNLSQPVGMDRNAFLAAWETFNRIVHDIVREMHGSISAEHGIGLIKRDELPHYKDPVALDLMFTLKRALDPANILNPGKVLALGENLPDALPAAGA
ncbi:FAD-binding oxidoreductase [Enterovirga aerilata]|uniref:FAD-binding oxidoreductase n=1 Tax=Enterovirga aerilata TaxID=2730920 RepID=A0A849ICA8_9HYPH|nr:FAD-binding oxidoreductase [Enterovirga sp. DB1703]NNM71563.1 FAD-binding oxidoreductase [Enterovirga sp. DB1703]